MTINTENIIRNSDIMFDILNNALSKSNDIKEDAHFVTIGLLCTEFEYSPQVI